MTDDTATGVAVLCTCHPHSVVTLDGAEWVHDDLTAATVSHVHVSFDATDCDGRVSQEFVTRPNSLRPGVLDTPDDLWDHLVRNATPTGNPYGKSTSEAYTDDNGVSYFTAYEPNDEGGGRSTHLRSCTDPGCAYDRSSQRDYRAEAAGY